MMDKITPEILLNAYCSGFFPMASPEENEQIYWYKPDPRTILPLDSFRISRSLRKKCNSATFELRIDTQFRKVMEYCSAPGKGRESTWISSEIIDLYTQLHEMGFAHSVESWKDGELVGGLYGVCIKGAFFGESMFHFETDASKVALVNLVDHLKRQGIHLLDVQYTNDHLRQFGIAEIPAADYEELLEEALSSQSSWS